jgi:hypothetical protein
MVVPSVNCHVGILSDAIIFPNSFSAETGEVRHKHNDTERDLWDLCTCPYGPAFDQT